jgi:hypothetical protein
VNSSDKVLRRLSLDRQFIDGNFSRQNGLDFRGKHSLMLETELADEGRAKMSESKNEVIKFDVVVVGSCMTDLVR